MDLLQFPASINKVETLVDRTLKMTINTPELGSEDMAKLFGYRNMEGWLIFKPTKIEESDIAKIPEEVKEFKTDKTPSQRLRNVIYMVWKNNTNRKESFNDFYQRHIEKIINQYKEKLG